MNDVGWLLVVVLLLLGSVTISGFPEEDLVVRLPGQPKVSFRQYAGYVDVDFKHGRSIFYYFVEAETEPHHKPLTLWLNGGPGCSSIGGGAFMELGPFLPKGDGRGLRTNSKSWNKVSNLLFVESPAGVGWSYSNTSSDYNTGDAKTAEDMYLFLKGWFKKFPALKTRDLFLTGESYAGHYIPQLAVTLLDHNEHSSGFKFNIKGVAIGNPLLNLDVDTQATYEYFWSHGMMSDELGLTIMNDCDFNDYMLTGPTHNLTTTCFDAISTANDIVGKYINWYDVIIDVCYPSIAEQELILRKSATKISFGVDVSVNYELDFYLNLPAVQKALHANRTKLPYRWSACNPDDGVLHYNISDISINILPLLKRIIQNHIPIWVYSGDQDSVVPLLGSRTLVSEVAKDLKLKVTVPYGAWFHEHQVGGWATEYGNILTFATVRVQLIWYLMHSLHELCICSPHFSEVRGYQIQHILLSMASWITKTRRSSRIDILNPRFPFYFTCAKKIKKKRDSQCSSLSIAETSYSFNAEYETCILKLNQQEKE